MSYEFRSGQTILIALDVVEGSVSDVESVTASMRSVAQPPVTRELEVIARPAAGADPAGWTIRGDSEGLPVGLYRVDADVRVAGIRVITEPVRIRIKPR